MSGLLGKMAKMLSEHEMAIHVNKDGRHRPPYYPSYPSYPSYPGGPPPPGPYPPYPQGGPPPYNPSFPGPPGPSVSPMYPVLPSGGFEHNVEPRISPMMHTSSVSRGCYPSHCTPIPARTAREPWPATSIHASPMIHTSSAYPTSTMIHTSSAYPRPPHLGHFHVTERSEYGWWWVQSSGGAVPSDAVEGGRDTGDSGPLYVGRAMHEGHLLPAKISPRHGCAYVSYAGEEITKIQYEVMCAPPMKVAWLPARGSEIPGNAIAVGSEIDEPLYVGRTIHEGSLTPGKVHRSHGVLYIPYGGREFSYHEYEILISL